MNYRLVVLITATIFVSGCAPKMIRYDFSYPTERLASQIEVQISEPEFDSAIMGIAVQSMKTGEIIYQHNANKLFLPASNEKILTCATTLIHFGPEFKFNTNLYASGDVEGGVLHGDLIVTGSGDPTIGYRSCGDSDSCRVFKHWIEALKQNGIDSVAGNLIGVDDVFDDELIGYGWTYDNLSYSYAAQINGLTFNENYAQVKITADSTADSLIVNVFPDIGYVNVFPEIEIVAEKTAKTRIRFERILNTNDAFFRGTLHPGETYRRNISVHNPTLFFLEGFRSELREEEISVSGDCLDNDELENSLLVDDFHLIYTHESAPTADIIKILMKESQNLYAETFVKALGYYFGNEGTFDEGEHIIKRTLRKFGLADESYRYRDGSGLSRYNYVSPNHIIKILRGMYFHRYGDVFRSSLPIAGVDGTIGYRMKGTVAEGRISAKTGTISNVRCLSGYALTQDDEVLAFSIMVNNYLCSVNVVMDLQDRICMLLSSFSRER